LTLWDVVVELSSQVRDIVRNVQPRLNRLQRGYPFLRAVSNVFLRDIGTYMVVLDIMRGWPAMYTTYVGYDEIAHHVGLDRPDAMHSLRGLDRAIRRVRSAISGHAARPYDLILLSDHGQSSGATFKQRYGGTLEELIAARASTATRVSLPNTHDAGAVYSRALGAELDNMRGHRLLGNAGRLTLRAQRSLQKRLVQERPDEHEAPGAAHIHVCVSGNLANIYLDLHDGKVSLSELNATHPGLVDALVEHPGIGFVVGYDERGAPIVLGKHGTRSLRTAEVTGHDPLLPYGDPALRAQQLTRVADFPHSGDLIVNSTFYPDGTVAAFEELIGSHGGRGGHQTDAFVLHPADMHIEPTANATDVFAQLNARRGLMTPPTPPHRMQEADVWAPATLWRGLRDWRTWVDRAGRAFLLERAAYREVAHDGNATGPALLIALLASAIGALTTYLAGGAQLPLALETLLSLGSWLAIVVLIHAAGRMLRGTGSLTTTLRTLAYAEVTSVALLFGLLPTIGPALALGQLAFRLVATWIAVQEALNLSGWRTLLVPLIAALLLIATMVGGLALVSGTQVTIGMVLLRMGIGPAH
jgi:hypothetical protein